jgi:hypothetical protein
MDPILDPQYRPLIWTPNMDPKMDPKYGPPIWTPNMNPQYGPPNSNMNPHFDHQYGPHFDPQYKTPIWTPNMDPQYGPPFWTPFLDTKIIIDTLQNYNGHLQDAGYAQICASLVTNCKHYLQDMRRSIMQ